MDSKKKALRDREKGIKGQKVGKRRSERGSYRKTKRLAVKEDPERHTVPPDTQPKIRTRTLHLTVHRLGSLCSTG